VLAGGTAKPDDTRISVEARRGDTRFGICSTTFLEAAFRTDYYRIDITFNDDDSWSYVTRTDLAGRGTTPAFDHPRTKTPRRSGTTRAFPWKRGAATHASASARPRSSKRRFAPTITASTSPSTMTTAGAM